MKSESNPHHPPHDTPHTRSEFGPGFGHEEDAAHESHEPHAVSLGTLTAVFGALLFLTVITVAVTYVDLGTANLFVALLIAVIKGTLVVAFFMHLWWDSPFNTIALFAALAFVMIFIGASIQDTAEYRDNIVDYEAAHPLSVMSRPSSVGSKEMQEADTVDNNPGQ